MELVWNGRDNNYALGVEYATKLSGRISFFFALWFIIRFVMSPRFNAPKTKLSDVVHNHDKPKISVIVHYYYCFT